MTNRTTTVSGPLGLRAGDTIVSDPDPASPTYGEPVRWPVAELPVGSGGEVAVEYITSSGEHDTLLLPSDVPVTIEPSPLSIRVAAATVLVDLAGRGDLPPMWNWELRQGHNLRGQLSVDEGEEREELARWAEFLGAEIVQTPYGDHSPNRAEISTTADYLGVQVEVWTAVDIGDTDLRELRDRLIKLTGLPPESTTDQLVQALERTTAGGSEAADV